MAKNSFNFDEFLDAFAEIVAEKIVASQSKSTAKADTKASSTKGRGKAKAEPEPEEEEEENEDEAAARREELEGMTIVALRKIAIALEFDEKQIKAEKDKEVLIDSILEAEAEDGEEEEEEGEEESEGYDRDELEDMSLADLKKLAKENGATTAQLKGLDTDDIIEWLMSDDSGDEEEEEEEQDYSEMSLAELKAEMKTRGLKVPRGADEDAIIEILEENDAE